jgi:hypothetical protein
MLIQLSAAQRTDASNTQRGTKPTSSYSSSFSSSLVKLVQLSITLLETFVTKVLPRSLQTTSKLTTGLLLACAFMISFLWANIGIVASALYTLLGLFMVLYMTRTHTYQQLKIFIQKILHFSAGAANRILNSLAVMLIIFLTIFTHVVVEFIMATIVYLIILLVLIYVGYQIAKSSRKKQ